MKLTTVLINNLKVLIGGQCFKRYIPFTQSFDLHDVLVISVTYM